MTKKQNVTTKITTTSLMLATVLIGTAALPAHAVEATSTETIKTVQEAQQSLTTNKLQNGTQNFTLETIETEIDWKAVEAAAKAAAEAEQAAQEQAQAEAAQAIAQQRTTQETTTVTTNNIPTGIGAEGLLAAARAQIGQNQDCTAMVERALRAIGYSVGDLGPMQFGQYGTIIPASEAKAGDILMRNGHVAIYSGDGTNHSAIHGGWGGNQTVESTYDADPTTYTVVRIP